MMIFRERRWGRVRETRKEQHEADVLVLKKVIRMFFLTDSLVKMGKILRGAVIAK